MRYTNMKAALATCEDDIRPPGAANTGGNPFARMRAVFSETKPWAEQNSARLYYVVTLRQYDPVRTRLNRLQKKKNIWY
jgi:hypothetical protein